MCYSRRLPQGLPAVVIPCAFGLSPEFSTPVEKTVENRILAEMNLWDELLARIETKVNRHSFYTWFRPTTFVSEDRSSLTVKVPNALFKDWLTKHYAGVISEATVELRRPNVVVIFVADATEGPVIPLSAEEAAALETVPPAPPQPSPAGLNPRYTFDTF